MCMQEFRLYKPSVGDVMFIAEERAIGKHKMLPLKKTVVVSVGVKYFTLEAMPKVKFYIDSKKPHENTNTFPVNYRLYPSEYVYNEQMLGMELLKAVASQFGGNNRNYVETTSINNIKKACELLGVSLEQPNHN